MIRQLSLSLIATVAVTTASYAVVVNQPSPIKTYQLTNLQRVVTNSDACKPLYNDLQQATKNPLVFQFSEKEGSPNFHLKDASGQLTSHNYMIVHQSIDGSVVHRTGVGDFMLNGQSVHYVIEIAADTSQPNFKYEYPIILSGDNAHCYYTGLVNPDAKTVSDFKQSIASGLVAKKADLCVAKK